MKHFQTSQQFEIIPQGLIIDGIEYQRCDEYIYDMDGEIVCPLSDIADVPAFKAVNESIEYDDDRHPCDPAYGWGCRSYVVKEIEV